MTRVLVTGSRDWAAPGAVSAALYGAMQELGPFTLIHGACMDKDGRLRGADAFAHEWARAMHFQIEPHPARNHPTQDFGPWPACGPRRNAYMISRGADLVLAFRRRGSKGTSGCIEMAKAARIPVRVWEAAE